MNKLMNAILEYLNNGVQFNKEFCILNIELLTTFLDKKKFKYTTQVHLYQMLMAKLYSIRLNNFTLNIPKSLIDDFYLELSKKNYYLAYKYDFLSKNKNKYENIIEIPKNISTICGNVIVSNTILGRGTNSVVYKAILSRNDGSYIDVAIKIQPSTDCAKEEGDICTLLSDKPGFPSYYCHGKYGDIYYIICNILGNTFKQFINNKNNNNRFSINKYLTKKWIDFVTQLISILKTLYINGLFHLDVSVTNILFDSKQPDTIVLIDYYNIGKLVNETEENFNRISNGSLHYIIINILTSIINDYNYEDIIYDYEEIIIKTITNLSEPPPFDLLIQRLLLAC
jgi:hypothetical protein